jgi:hypothetical protein
MVRTTPVAERDKDHDGFDDGWDNCPDLANPDQPDSDSSKAGDACDALTLKPTPDSGCSTLPGTRRGCWWLGLGLAALGLAWVAVALPESDVAVTSRPSASGTAILRHELLLERRLPIKERDSRPSARSPGAPD